MLTYIERRLPHEETGAIASHPAVALSVSAPPRRTTRYGNTPTTWPTMEHAPTKAHLRREERREVTSWTREQYRDPSIACMNRLAGWTASACSHLRPAGGDPDRHTTRPASRSRLRTRYQFRPGRQLHPRGHCAWRTRYAAIDACEEHREPNMFTRGAVAAAYEFYRVASTRRRDHAGRIEIVGTPNTTNW